MHRYPHWPIHLALSIVCALMLVPFINIISLCILAFGSRSPGGQAPTPPSPQKQQELTKVG